jgi:hypothetical protein
MKEILENIGLSEAAYREGYVALAEDIIANGRQMDVSLNASDAYFVYQVDELMSLWGYFSKDEVLSVLALRDTPCKHFSKVLQMEPFESNPSRGASVMEIGGIKNPSDTIKIYAEIVNYMLVKNKYPLSGGRQPSAVLINGFLQGDSLKIYGGSKEYCEAYDHKPGASENSIVCLKSVNREETPAEMTPFAHVTAEVTGYKELINAYSRERFISVEALCKGLKFSFFTGYDRTTVEKLSRTKSGAIIEADAYFAAKL